MVLSLCREGWDIDILIKNNSCKIYAPPHLTIKPDTSSSSKALPLHLMRQTRFMDTIHWGPTVYLIVITAHYGGEEKELNTRLPLSATAALQLLSTYTQSIPESQPRKEKLALPRSQWHFTAKLVVFSRSWQVWIKPRHNSITLRKGAP